jgi:fructose-1,6-bisphosphatase
MFMGCNFCVLMVSGNLVAHLIIMMCHMSSCVMCRQVRTASCGAANCINSFGDEQLAVDLLADKLLFEALKFSVSLPQALP